jgi:hypothetical protein
LPKVKKSARWKPRIIEKCRRVGSEGVIGMDPEWYGGVTAIQSRIS